MTPSILKLDADYLPAATVRWQNAESLLASCSRRGDLGATRGRIFGPP